MVSPFYIWCVEEVFPSVHKVWMIFSVKTRIFLDFIIFMCIDSAATPPDSRNLCDIRVAFLEQGDDAGNERRKGLFRRYREVCLFWGMYIP
jgi:hypothetical protein